MFLPPFAPNRPTSKMNRIRQAHDHLEETVAQSRAGGARCVREVRELKSSAEPTRRRSKSKDVRITCNRLTEAHVHKAGTCRVDVVKLKLASRTRMYPRCCVPRN